MSAPMVQAIIEGRKSQTRRIIKPQPTVLAGGRGTHWSCPRWPKLSVDVPDDLARHGPHGEPGDLLWVRETCRAYEVPDGAEGLAFAEKYDYDTEFPPYGLDGVIYLADEYFREIENSPESSAQWHKLYHYRGKPGSTVPPIHMPRWASRLTLRITGARVERLQEISEKDAKAEGIHIASTPSPWTGKQFRATTGQGFVSPEDSWHHTAVGAYADLWRSINGEDSWDLNPWVWVIEFERIEQQAKAA